MNIVKRGILLATFAFGCFMSGAAVAAESPEQKGLSIAMLADSADVGWRSYRAKGEMILRDADGKESVRALESLNFERDSKVEGDWLLRDVPLIAAPAHIRAEW